MTKPNKDSKDTVEYFERPNPIWYIIIIPSMIYVSVLAYLPDIIPFHLLGFLGDISKYLYLNHKIITVVIFWAAWAVHFLEAIYVVTTANKLNINTQCRSRWFMQTLLLGYPSTTLMNKYYNKQKKN